MEAVKLKKSKQRDAILAFLKTRKDHPTADTIYDNVKKDIPNISLGTVYRNLAVLTEIGEIQKLSFDGSSDRYDPVTAPHCHFRCRNCGSVYDVDVDPDFLNSISLPKEGFPGQVEGQITVFYGTCEKCMDQYS
ncbi:MAG: transcriptional repressor [Lachnospiraceae bacterium]|nr:transcriptional repressor [Lachnospiraceae bacterium]